MGSIALPIHVQRMLVLAASGTTNPSPPISLEKLEVQSTNTCGPDENNSPTLELAGRNVAWS